MSRIIVDTSVWIQFFNLPRSKEKEEVDKLLIKDSVAITGVIISELLQGSRSKEEFDKIADKITALPYLQASRDIWKRVGELSFELRKQGITIPLSDILIAVLALENNCQIYTLDPHFKKIPEVDLYSQN